MSQLPAGIGTLAKELIQNNMSSSQRRILLDAALISPEALSGLSSAMGLQLSGAKKVAGILDGSDMNKSPLPNIRISRVDFGFRNKGGNVGFIKGYDLPSEWGKIELNLSGAVDRCREDFSAHFGFYSVGLGYRALVCTAPILGGVRGTARTSQAIIFHEKDVPYGANLSDLMNALPPLPDTIGEESKWNTQWVPQSISESVDHRNLIFFNLARIAPFGSDFYVADGMDDLQKMQLILDTFSMTPIGQRRNFPTHLTTHVSGGSRGKSLGEWMDRKSVKTVTDLKENIPGNISPHVLEIHKKLTNSLGSNIFNTIKPSLSYEGTINNIESSFVYQDIGTVEISRIVRGLTGEFGEKFSLAILEKSFELLMEDILKAGSDGISKKRFFNLYQGIKEVDQGYAYSLLNIAMEKVCKDNGGSYSKLYVLLKPDSESFGFPSLRPIDIFLGKYTRELPLSDVVFQSILGGLVRLAGIFPKNIPYLSKEQRQMVIEYGQVNPLHGDIKTALLESAGFIEKIGLKKSLR